VIMLLLLGSILFYSGYIGIELRSYMLLHALSLDHEREKRQQYLIHGALYYGAVLYKKYKATWQLPHRVEYTSILGERITLEFIQVTSNLKSKCIEIRAVINKQKNLVVRCKVRVREHMNEHGEPEFELEFKK
jgi:hypothetical protein